MEKADRPLGVDLCRSAKSHLSSGGAQSKATILAAPNLAIFCETDLAVTPKIFKIKAQAIKPLIYQPKPLRHSGQRGIHERIVLGC